MRRPTATALIALTLLAGCTQSPPRDTDTELALGEKVFDAVRLPDDWTPAGHTGELDLDSAILQWNRFYRAKGTTASAATQVIGNTLTGMGWHANGSCMGPGGQQCFFYEWDGYEIHPTTTDVVCPDGKPGCVLINLWMTHL